MKNKYFFTMVFLYLAVGMIGSFLKIYAVDHIGDMFLTLSVIALFPMIYLTIKFVLFKKRERN